MITTYHRATAAILFLSANVTFAVPAAGKQKPHQIHHRSPQYAAFEIKLGPYSPDIDSEFSGGETPFADLFGDGLSAMIQLEGDWQIWGGFGSIGIGISAGFFTKSARTFQDDGGNNAPSSGDVRSAGSTSITLVPLALLAVYRFDVLANRWAIPIVPYVKFGPTYTLWFIRDGNGDLSRSAGSGSTGDGSSAQGATWGLQFNAGAALQLDFLEPRAAKTLDHETGVNHSYLFVELLLAQANGFGSSSALRVGDTTLMAGLAFEM